MIHYDTGLRDKKSMTTKFLFQKYCCPFGIWLFVNFTTIMMWVYKRKAWACIEWHKFAILNSNAWELNKENMGVLQSYSQDTPTGYVSSCSFLFFCFICLFLYDWQNWRSMTACMVHHIISHEGGYHGHWECIWITHNKCRSNMLVFDKVLHNVAS